MGLTPRQFAALQQRLEKRRRGTASLEDAAPASPAPRPAVILGIDPSLRGTGYGVIRTGKPAVCAMAYGVVTCPSTWLRTRCLARIADQLREVVTEWQPTACAVEGLFYAQNLKTALIMGEARGACLVAAATAGLDIYEVAPRKVKQAIVGYGAAQKVAVARMVQRLLALADLPPPDAADALALALTLANELGRPHVTPPQRL